MQAEKPRSRQLDTLRALAILGVFVAHFLPKAGWLPWGQIGVRLFFVLSGFLITNILLGCREEAERTGGQRFYFIRQFYCRRFLRIFPLYYFVIAGALLVGLEPARQLAGWLLTYTLNLRIGLWQEWPDHFSHFWSLCVEEQFYLFWPLCILFLPRRWLAPLMIATVLAAPLLRFFLVDVRENWVAVYVLTGVSFDALGMGALATLTWRASNPGKMKRFFDLFALPVGLVVVIVLEILIRTNTPAGTVAYGVFYDLGWSLIFYRLVLGAWTGFAGIVGKLFELRPLTYIGEISYGLYVYHGFVPVLVAWFCMKIGGHTPRDPWTKFFIFSAVAMCLAAVSWHLFEKPLNDLKRYFEYKDRRPDPVQPADEVLVK